MDPHTNPAHIDAPTVNPEDVEAIKHEKNLIEKTKEKPGGLRGA